MPRYILKVAPDRDLYLEWSTVVEAPTFVGNREETITHLGGRVTRGAAIDVADRLDRADATGTSAFSVRVGDRVHLGDGAWDDTPLIYRQEGLLRRAKIPEVADRMVAAGRGEYDITDLLEPFDDEDDYADDKDSHDRTED